MNMEANPLTLAIVAVVLIALLIFILIRNNRDKDEYIKSLNKTDENSLLLEKGTGFID